MAEHTLTLPDLGEEAGARAVVCLWHKAEGDRVEADDEMVEVIYDKATFYVPSPVTGVLKKIVAPERAEVPAGGPLAIVETDEA